MDSRPVTFQFCLCSLTDPVCYGDNTRQSNLLHEGLQLPGPLDPIYYVPIRNYLVGAVSSLLPSSLCQWQDETKGCSLESKKPTKK